MRLLMVWLIAMLGFASPSSAETLSNGAFAKLYARELQAALPSFSIKVPSDDELKLTRPDGSEVSLFLASFYQQYQNQPETLSQLVKTHAGALKQAATVPAKLDTSHIFPVVKDRPWLADMARSMKARGTQFSPLYDDLNAELVIVYAEDQPQRTRYIDANEIQMDKAALRALAVNNLRKTLPPIKFSQGGPVGFITVDGDYEASLLLLDEVWSNGQIKMNGETVVAIPGHDTLLVIGSADPEALMTFRTLVATLGASAKKPLTNTLFVYRGGKFVKFEAK